MGSSVALSNGPALSLLLAMLSKQVSIKDNVVLKVLKGLTCLATFMFFNFCLLSLKEQWIHISEMQYYVQSAGQAALVVGDILGTE